MNITRIISIAVLLLLIQGCKITQVAPAEGSIASRTGNHNCAAGQTCVIDIPGVPFSDTFTAVPNPGYRFVSWKKQPYYLCGSSSAPCALEGIPTTLTEYPDNYTLQPIFEKIDLLKLLPAATRGLFQILPGAPGAMDTSVAGAGVGSGPLQILQQYSAGMEIADNAERMVLAQLSDHLDQFILLAKLDGADVDAVMAGASLSSAGTHAGFPVWSIDGTDLQLAKIDSVILAIAPQSALQQALNAYTGTGAAIATGPLGSYLSVLANNQPNNMVYGLPALYGAVPAPGSGTASLSQARVVSAGFKVQSGVLSGGMAFFGPNASTYTSKLQQQLSGFPTPTVVASGQVAIVVLNGLTVEDGIRPLLKTLVLDMDMVDYTAAVVHGGNPPWMNFNVGGDPAAIFVSFEFESAEQIANFEAAHLPPGFHLVPFRLVEGEPLRNIMVLNMYQSSGGLVSGARAEWAVFVADPDSAEPRFLVLEARAQSITADPVTPGILTFGEPVSYTLQGGALIGEVGVGGDYFYVSIPWPQPPSTHVPFAREFMPSNDYVFWGNAVADKILYNSTTTNRDAAVVPAGQFTMVDNSPWAAYVNDVPLQAVVYLNNQEIVISPWWNLDREYLDVTPARRQALIDFKNNFYPATVQSNAQKAIRGQDVVPSAFTTADSVPTAYYHFPLLDAVGLLDAAAGPGVFTPTPIALFADEPADYYLTLAVQRREDDPCGLRAEWLTYVVGSSGRPESVRLEAFAGDACLEPAALLSLATKLSQGVTGATLTTQISSPFLQFDASVDLSSTDEELAGLNWLEATERVCSVNGICDEFYYDGQLVLIAAQRADSLTTTVTALESPWQDYIDVNGVRAGVRLNPSMQAVNPWRNLRPFAAAAPVP